MLCRNSPSTQFQTSSLRRYHAQANCDLDISDKILKYLFAQCGVVLTNDTDRKGSTFSLVLTMKEKMVLRFVSFVPYDMLSPSTLRYSRLGFDQKFHFGPEKTLSHHVWYAHS